MVIRATLLNINEVSEESENIQQKKGRKWEEKYLQNLTHNPLRGLHHQVERLKKMNNILESQLFLPLFFPRYIHSIGTCSTLDVHTHTHTHIECHSRHVYTDEVRSQSRNPGAFVFARGSPNPLLLSLHPSIPPCPSEPWWRFNFRD